MGTLRIWVTSELYYPEETSTGFLLTRIAESLATAYEVRAVCSQPTYAQRGVRAPREEERNGVRIHRCRSTTLDKNRLFLRLINMLTITAAMFFYLLVHLRRGDPVLVVTNPPLLPFAVTLAARLRRARTVLLVHDVFPEAFVATGLLRSRALATRVFQKLNARVYRSAERIVVLGRDMRELVYGKIGVEERDKVVLIPNWADLELVSPLPRSENPLLRELGVEGQFVVLYAGNIGRTHGVEWLVEAAESLKTRAAFVFLGSGAKRAWLEETARARNLTNVRVLAERPRKDQPVFLNACDVSIISFVRGMRGVSVPSRMYNVFAAGKPIVAMAERDSELALVLAEGGAGWVVEPGDVDALTMLLARLSASPEEVAEAGRNARSLAEREYSFEQIADRYRTLFAALSQRGV